MLQGEKKLTDLKDAVFKILEDVESKHHIKVNKPLITLFLKKRDEGKFGGRNPASIAGALLYLTSLQNGTGRSQRDCANFAGITEVSIRQSVIVLDPNRTIKRKKSSDGLVPPMKVEITSLKCNLGHLIKKIGYYYDLNTMTNEIIPNVLYCPTCRKFFKAGVVEIELVRKN